MCDLGLVGALFAASAATTFYEIREKSKQAIEAGTAEHPGEERQRVGIHHENRLW